MTMSTREWSAHGHFYLQTYLPAGFPLTPYSYKYPAMPVCSSWPVIIWGKLRRGNIPISHLGVVFCTSHVSVTRFWIPQPITGQSPVTWLNDQSQPGILITWSVGWCLQMIFSYVRSNFYKDNFIIRELNKNKNIIGEVYLFNLNLCMNKFSLKGYFESSCFTSVLISCL